MGQLSQIELDGGPASVRKARAFVDATLAAWHLEELRDVAVLLTSELATNAVVHARTPFRLTVQLDGVVTVEVADGSPGVPKVEEAVVDDDRGRGLALVEKLASSWGSRTEGSGKTVWFVLELPDRPGG